jgi:TRAP-type mannitol/chloroaromatic compound transport system permease small subunit
MFYIFVGTLLWKSLPWAWQSLMIQEYTDSTWGPPVWPVKWTIPIAALLMLLQGMTKTLKDACLAVTGREIFPATDTEPRTEN